MNKSRLLALVFAVGASSGWLVSRISSVETPKQSPAKTGVFAHSANTARPQSASPIASFSRFYANNETPSARTEQADSTRHPLPLGDGNEQDSMPENAIGRSAGEVLAELERAYQSQEQRIQRLEMALHGASSTVIALDSVPPTGEQLIAAQETENPEAPSEQTGTGAETTDVSSLPQHTDDLAAQEDPKLITVNVYETEVHEGDTIHGDVIHGDVHRSQNGPQQVIIHTNAVTNVGPSHYPDAAATPSPSGIARTWGAWESGTSQSTRSNSQISSSRSTLYAGGTFQTKRPRESARKRNPPRRGAAVPQSKGLAPRHDPWAKIDYNRHNNPFDSAFGH